MAIIYNGPIAIRDVPDDQVAQFTAIGFKTTPDSDTQAVQFPGRSGTLDFGVQTPVQIYSPITATHKTIEETLTPFDEDALDPNEDNLL